MLALVGVVNLPIIKFSVDWWNTLHQPASVMRIGGPRIDISMLAPLLIMALGFTLLFVALLMLRMRTALNERKAMALRLNAGAVPSCRVPSASGPFLPAPRCLDGRYRRLSRDGRLRRRSCGRPMGWRSRFSAGSPLFSWRRYRESTVALERLQQDLRQETMTRKQQRLGLLALGMAALGGATLLVLSAFNDNLVFFYSPSELKAKAVAADRRVRIGGLVEAQSLSRGGRRAQLSRFASPMARTTSSVVYQGLLPDLFREGQGAVAEGKLRPDGVFAASSVLAKHDENYMPREVVDALKKSGHWQEGACGCAAAGAMRDAG